MRKSILFLLIAAAAMNVSAATRLTYVMNGQAKPVAWSSFPVEYQVDRRLANAFPGAGGVVDRAFAVWAAVPDTNVSFRSLGVVDGAIAGRDSRNTVSLSDDLFSGQGFIALTTNWYDDSARLLEADIQIDATLVKSDYNVQLAIQHEVGHLLGLDHSAVISSVMFPYVGRGSFSPSLDSDDRIAIMSSYPKGDPALLGATLQGKVVGNGGGIFAAQVVAVNDDGSPVATALSDASGDFIIMGLPAGSYRLYAEPLDGPVDARNLTGVYRQASSESFPSHFADGPPMSVRSGEKYGNLNVNNSGSPVHLNPRWVAACEPTTVDFNLTATPVTLHPGQTANIAVAGDGFTGGMTTFDVLNPGFERVGDFRYAGNFVYATFHLGSDTPPGSAVIVVKSGNETAMLTGALRVQGAEGGGRTRVARK
jgi:hypothetical protein